MKILVTDPVAGEGIELLRKHVDVDVKLKIKPNDLLASIEGYEALVVRSETKVSMEVIERGKKLLVIGRAGTGVDNIDVAAATRRGIVVVNAPAGNTRSAAEHAIAMMFALARHISQAHSTLKSGVWDRKSFIGTELENKTLGIVGLGNVGTEVARCIKGLQMHLIAYDPLISEEYAMNLGIQPVSLEELLKTSDFITLHLPLIQATKGLIGKKELDMVKPSMRLINCARGGLVDEDALLQAIEEGRVAGAAIDVFSKEPDTDNPLLKCNKVIATPHLGASTAEAQVNVSVAVAEQILTVLQGKPARYAVNAPLIAAEAFPVLAPFIEASFMLGRLGAQLADGQMNRIDVDYDGEVANYDTAALKAAIIGGLLQRATEERVNIVNAAIVAQSRGLKITEHKRSSCENYSNLISITVASSAGTAVVSCTVMRGQTHIVRVNDHWFNLAQTEGYFLLINHRDKPGLIGAVGMITGNADVNISFMELSRLKQRGDALMVLALDEPLNAEQCQEILTLSDVHSLKMVHL